MRTKFKNFSILILALAFLFVSELPASAGVKSTTQQSYNLTTGTWSTELASATSASAKTQYQVVWTGNANKIYALFSVINTGSFELTGGHISYSSAKPNGDATGAPNLIFDLCSGTWDPNNFSCSGTITTFGSGISGTANYLKYQILGERLVLRLTHLRNNSTNFITYLNTYTSRSDIRSGVTIGS